MFFSVFEAGRQVARDVRQFLSQNNVLTDREWFARTVQAVVIICGGSLAGLMYGLIGRPFDVRDLLDIVGMVDRLIRRRQEASSGNDESNGQRNGNRTTKAQRQ